MSKKRTKTVRSSVKETAKNAAPETMPVPVQPNAAPDTVASAAIESHPVSDGTDDESPKFRAAVALNLCMVSLSQIVDYNDINILRMEYEAILNNINMEVFPKDDPLFDALNSILDTCHFFMLYEKDKEVLKKKQALKLKAGLSNINFFFGIIGGGNPYVAAANLALMIGVAAVNYKSQKAKAEYENEAEKWALEKSAREQLHRLRGALFATAWRLADKYQYPDEWRLTEKQIKLYNEILADPDPFSRLYRLEIIQDKFKAYPLFFYYLAHAAIETANDDRNKENEDFKQEMYEKAEDALNKFKKAYAKAKLLREDLVAASAFLDLAEVNYEKGLLYQALDDITEARILAGFDFAILQNCVFQYLRITNSEKRDPLNKTKIWKAEEDAIQCLNILVANDYNLDINSMILSRLYIEHKEKKKYDVLKQLVSNRSSFVYRHILMWDEKKADKIKYEKEVRKFFASPELSYTIYLFFERTIVLAVLPFIYACFETLKRNDTVPLRTFFDKKSSKDDVDSDIFLYLSDCFWELVSRDKKYLPVKNDYMDVLCVILNASKDNSFTSRIKAVDSNSQKDFFPNPFSWKDSYSAEEHEKNFSDLKDSIFEFIFQIGALSCVLSDFFMDYFFAESKDIESPLKLLDFFEEKSESNRKKISKVIPVAELALWKFNEFTKYKGSSKQRMSPVNKAIQNYLESKKQNPSGEIKENN